MTTYAELPDDQKKAIALVTNILREEAGQFARLAARISAELDSSGTAYAAAIVGGLDAGEYVPNESGLRGAVALTKEQLLAILTLADAVRDLLTVEARKNCIDAAGPLACVG